MRRISLARPDPFAGRNFFPKRRKNHPHMTKTQRIASKVCLIFVSSTMTFS
jgi:hypothetical protein